MGETQQHCRNCQAPVTGEYCSQCGQREGRADQRFLDLAGELVGDVLDMDSRFWRTLAYLLFRPGFLSAEFIAGRRARYLPPLRLYLIISFVVFLVMSFNSTSVVNLKGENAGADEDDALVTIINDEVAEAVQESEAEIEAEANPETEAEDPNEWNVDIGLSSEASPQWLRDAEQRMETNARKLRKDPDEFIETMVGYLPQLMFLLLPVFALLLQIAYLLSSFHYLQHLVFALHYHSFAYLLYLLAQLERLFQVDVDGWLMLGLFIYLPLAFRRCYGSSWGGALGKSLFVYISYAFSLIFGFAGAAMLALMLL